VATATKTPKAAIPTEKQRAVLEALNGGRAVKITEANGKKSVMLVTASGKPVKDAPKLDRGAIESCQKKGWVCESSGTITDDGKKAKKAK
jgi:hypothetical protein